ncbi:unnamed protein product [Rhizoctonia solani]|uniref:Uncharacterized protein n=1 Tax=Rhizoctonia solani TaxID=456999 RepID=A0A8H3GPK0_9AGAM|nr:unnamed protein product [Rhizoctonia solani]
MIAFGRVANILLLVLSLSFLVCASPSSRMSSHKVAKSRAVSAHQEAGSMAQLTTLEATLRKQMDACMKAKTADDAGAVVKQVVVHIQTTTESIKQFGKIDVDESATTDIVIRLACIIEIIVKIMLKISRKFGSEVVVSLCAEVDASLKDLLVVVGGLGTGILALVVKKIVDVKTDAILKLDLVQCAKVLGLTV